MYTSATLGKQVRSIEGSGGLGYDKQEDSQSGTSIGQCSFDESWSGCCGCAAKGVCRKVTAPHRWTDFFQHTFDSKRILTMSPPPKRYLLSHVNINYFMLELVGKPASLLCAKSKRFLRRGQATPEYGRAEVWGRVSSSIPSFRSCF